MIRHRFLRISADIAIFTGGVIFLFTVTALLVGTYEKMIASLLV